MSYSLTTGAGTLLIQTSEIELKCLVTSSSERLTFRVKREDTIQELLDKFPGENILRIPGSFILNPTKHVSEYWKVGPWIEDRTDIHVDPKRE